MAGESAARRYARAAFELALERGQRLEDWLADLESFAAVAADPRIHTTLVSPKLSFAHKRSMVDQAITGLDPLRQNFLLLLIDRKRVDLLEPIRREFRAMMLEHQGVAEATVTTAVPISDAEATRIGDMLGRMVGRKVIVQRQVDPSIVGGLVARVGDTLINGSVAARLQALREQLA